MQRLRLTLACLLVTTTTGCAAMFTGTKSEIYLVTDPPGATVQVGEQQYVTPATIKISKKVKQVTATHPDHGTQEVPLGRKLQGGMVLMDFLFTPGFGLSGFLIDGGTGAWYKHPSIVDYKFVEPAASAGPQEAVAARP